MVVKGSTPKKQLAFLAPAEANVGVRAGQGRKLPTQRQEIIMVSTQEIVIFMVVIFILLLILIAILLYEKRSPISDESGQNDKLEQARKDHLAARRKLEEISPILSTPLSPELEIGTEEPPLYHQKRYFFTYQEGKFFEFLSISVRDKYQIFAKVRMADVLYLANEPIKKKYFNNHIRCRHFDYILCERAEQKPIMAIELDDSSHQRYDRTVSDKFKNLACRTAGLPLLRIKLPYNYSHEELFNLIRAEIENP